MGDRPAHNASDGEGVVHDIFRRNGSMVAIALGGFELASEVDEAYASFSH